MELQSPDILGNDRRLAESKSRDQQTDDQQYKEDRQKQELTRKPLPDGAFAGRTLRGANREFLIALWADVRHKERGAIPVPRQDMPRRVCT